MTTSKLNETIRIKYKRIDEIGLKLYQSGWYHSKLPSWSSLYSTDVTHFCIQFYQVFKYNISSWTLHSFWLKERKDKSRIWSKKPWFDCNTYSTRFTLFRFTMDHNDSVYSTKQRVEGWRGGVGEGEAWRVVEMLHVFNKSQKRTEVEGVDR